MAATRSTLIFNSNPSFFYPKNLQLQQPINVVVFPISISSYPKLISLKNNPLLLNNNNNNNNGGSYMPQKHTNYIIQPAASNQRNLLSSLADILTKDDTKAPKYNLRSFNDLCALAFDLLAICLVRVVKVPYLNEYRFVFEWQQFLRSKVAQYKIKRLEHSYRILPPSHPKTIRVMTLAREVAQAMHNGLGLVQDCSVRAYAPTRASNSSSSNNNSNDDSGALIVGARRDLEKLRDNNRIVEFGRACKCSTKHLEGREWRVIVIDSYNGNAEMYADGTMVVYTRLIDSCSDEELAFVLGHEFGHFIARHPQHLSMYIVLGTLQLFSRSWTQLHRTLLLAEVALRFFEKRIKQRDEFETDYIGMMLMACAGYDPQTAPKYWRKRGNQVPEYWRKQGNHVSKFFSSHPSNTKRAESLEKPEKMNKALALYREVKATRDSTDLRL